MIRALVNIIDFREVYILYRPFWYIKIGISKDADRRRTRVDDAVRGRVYKIIALPFIWASFWEGLLLFITLPFSRCPPLYRKKKRTDAGATEWRILPLGWLFLPLALIGLWYAQLWLLSWVITSFLLEDPVNLTEALTFSFQTFKKILYESRI